MQLIASAKLHLDVLRLNQADEHHADRLDLAERSLQARSQVGNYRPGTAVSVQMNAPANVTVYIPDNGRDAREVEQVGDV